MTTEAIEQIKQDRLENNLLQDMKDLLVYLEDKSVTDIAIPDSGEIIITRFGKGREFTGKFLSEVMTQRIILATAALNGKQLETYTGFPILEGIIPSYNARITGLMKPNTKRPELQIRLPPKVIYSLEDYVDSKKMTQENYEEVCRYIQERKNIVVSGSTGSGKTTFTNAVIKKMVEITPNDNFYIIEDVPELQCTAKMKTMLYVPKEFAKKAVEESLRWSPDRIIFGEVRNGIVMKELLEAWNTGHPGNVTTIHADSGYSTLLRIKGMLGENKDIQLSDTIQLVVHLKKTKEGIKVDELYPVNDETDSFLDTVYQNNLA